MNNVCYVDCEEEQVYVRDCTSISLRLLQLVCTSTAMRIWVLCWPLFHRHRRLVRDQVGLDWSQPHRVQTQVTYYEILGVIDCDCWRSNCCWLMARGGACIRRRS